MLGDAVPYYRGGRRIWHSSLLSQSVRNRVKVTDTRRRPRGVRGSAGCYTERLSAIASLARRASEVIALTHDDPSSPLASPASIGPFRVLHQLGAGVLGPVFRAHDPDADRLVAVKLFQLDFTPEQSRALADHLERLVAVWPAHPALVRVLAGGLEGHTPYLVSEYIASDSLDARLRRRVAGGFRQLLPVLAQVAAALDAAAEAGLAHGGLHPRDILVATTGDTHVTGVGVAQAIEAAGGRPPLRRPYAAPEQTGRLGWDHRADIYALAVLATELLAGRRPTPGGSASTLNDLLVQSEGLDPEACRRALAHALADSPGARPRRASDLVAMLQAAVFEPDADEDGGVPLDLPLRAGLEPEAPEATDEELEAVLASEEAAPLVTPVPVVLEAAPGQDEASWPQPVADEVVPLSPEPVSIEAARPEPAWPEPAWPEPASPEPSPPIARASIDDADDDAVYGAPARMTGHGREREPVGPPGREFIDPHPPASSRPLGLLAAVLLVGLLAGLAGGYLIWGRGTDASRGGAAGAHPAVPAAQGGEAAAGEAGPAPVVDEPLAPPVTTGPEGGPATPAAAQPAAPAKPAAPTLGRLIVRSTPSGARVIVDGRSRGTTPLTLVDLPLGTYGVRVVEEGYSERSTRVALTRTRPEATVTITLPRAAAQAAAPGTAPGRPAPAPPAASSAAASAPTSAAARLEVVSRPAGARVIMDGRPVGSTPLTLDRVAPGPHTIRLELDGYRPWTTTVRVQGGTPARVAASLETQD